MQIFHGSLVVMGKNRGNSLSCGGLSTVSVVKSWARVRSWNILSVSEGLASFPNRYHPRRALCMCESHVRSLSRLRCAGVTVYKGELFPLWLQLQTLHSLVNKVLTLPLLAGTLFPLDPALGPSCMWLCFIEFSWLTQLTASWKQVTTEFLNVMAQKIQVPIILDRLESSKKHFLFIT